MLCYSKFHFKQKLRGEEHQYTTNPFVTFSKNKNEPKNKNKNHEHQLFNNGASKDEAVNIFGFKSIWISL